MSGKGSNENRSSSRKKRKSNKVSRTLTYVLTPFLVLIIVCGILAASLNRPYNKLKPYFSVMFETKAIDNTTGNIHELTKYHADDLPPNIKPMVNERTEQVHTVIYPYYGDFYGTFTCENIGVEEYPIYAGTRYDLLDKGIGWYNGSKYIGSTGNVVLVGHNHTYFRDLPYVEIGSTIIIDTEFCTITYEVVDKQVFHYTDHTYVKQGDGHDRLTCYTCWNNGLMGLTEYRIAIISEPVKYEWKEVKQDK